MSSSRLHCAAIASATPGNVRDRIFQRSGPGEARCTADHALCSTVSFSGGVSRLVGVSGGRFTNSKPVALKKGSPNHHGWMICRGHFPSRDLAYLCITGFSIAFILILASRSAW